MGRLGLPHSRRFRWLVASVAVTLSSGCAVSPSPPEPEVPPTTVVVGARPATYPLLLPRSSARVGVYAAPEFRSAVVASDNKRTPDALFQVGGAAATLVDGIADALFAERVAVRERPSALVPAADVDLVLVPRIEAPTTYWTRTPTHVYALELEVLDPAGAPVARARSWNSSMPAFLGPYRAGVIEASRPAVEQFASTAAQLAVAMVLSPSLREWLALHELPFVWPEPAVSRSGGAPAGITIVRCVEMTTCTVTDATLALEDALRRLDPHVRIVDGEAFLEAMYPWLRGAPDLREEDVLNVFGRAAVRHRIAALGIRYVVDAVLRTLTSESGDIICAGGGRGGGCFGYKEWKEHESAALTVYDLEAGAKTRHDEFQRSYVSLALPAVIIPIPIPMGTIRSLYDEAAKRLLPLLQPAP